MEKSPFWQDNALFASKAKINAFLKFGYVKKKFQKKLILLFEVIVQPPKNTFEIRIFFFCILAQVFANVFVFCKSVYLFSIRVEINCQLQTRSFAIKLQVPIAIHGVLTYNPFYSFNEIGAVLNFAWANSIRPVRPALFYSISSYLISPCRN